jgi:pimeloyl-ACP methyl ester carboxylesterase
MLKRVLRIGLALVALACCVVAVAYLRWHGAQVARLEGGSRVAQTARGPVEYSIKGKGPRTILFVHGTPGGYDQGQRLEASALTRGFRFLTVSRPGYLRTPLSTGETPAAQADAYAALLDVLEIPRVTIMGASGGGPSSAQFAARHPDRCESLVMASALARPLPERPRPVSSIERLMGGTDFGAWIAWRQLRRDPAASLARRKDGASARIAGDPDRLKGYLALADSALVLVSRRVPGIANDRRQFVEMPEIPLASIRCPTMAVHGEDDTTVELAHARHVVNEVKGAELVVVKGAAHLVSISHPEETFGPIYAMLERIAHPPVLAPEADGLLDARGAIPNR